MRAIDALPDPALTWLAVATNGPVAPWMPISLWGWFADSIACSIGRRTGMQPDAAPEPPFPAATPAEVELLAAALSALGSIAREDAHPEMQQLADALLTIAHGLADIGALHGDGATVH